jgi:DNA-binding GntR family transcriptional regulator
MSRSNRLFKKSFNSVLDLITAGGEIDSISELARTIDVSRTTARHIIEHLVATGILLREGSGMALSRAPNPQDYFPSDETRPIDDVIRSAFMNWLSQESIAPGSSFSESEIARRLGVSTSAVREFLLRFSRFQLIRKEPRRHWIFEGFTRAYAEELYEIRALFELRSIERILVMDKAAPIWQRLERLRDEHVDLKTRLNRDYLEFSVLDARFHSTIYEASGNRFIAEFHDVISLVFHYRYRWNRDDEMERNAVAIDDHLEFLDAAFSGDSRRARKAMQAHLETARNTMLQSVDW